MRYSRAEIVEIIDTLVAEGESQSLRRLEKAVDGALSGPVRCTFFAGWEKMKADMQKALTEYCPLCGDQMVEVSVDTFVCAAEAPYER